MPIQARQTSQLWELARLLDRFAFASVFTKESGATDWNACTNMLKNLIKLKEVEQEVRKQFEARSMTD